MRANTVIDMSGRLFRSLLFIACLLVVALLSFADRAPGLVERALDRVQRIGSRGEHLLGVDWFDRGDIPFGWDVVGHAVLWAVVAFLAHLVFRSRVPSVFVALALVTLSAGVEVGQGLLSATRSPEMLDLIANAMGVGIGTSLAMIVCGLVGLLGGMARSLAR